MYAAAACISQLIAANKLLKTKKEPWWKRRVEWKLKRLNRDLDFMIILLVKRKTQL